MKEFLAMLKLYSVQIILLIAGLNTVIASIPDVPWWAVLFVNFCGVAAHHFALRTPQPAVHAQIKNIRASKE